MVSVPGITTPLLMASSSLRCSTTANAQPAVMGVSVAVGRVLESRGVRLADHAAFVAGHSLG